MSGKYKLSKYELDTLTEFGIENPDEYDEDIINGILGREPRLAERGSGELRHEQLVNFLTNISGRDSTRPMWTCSGRTLITGISYLVKISATPIAKSRPPSKASKTGCYDCGATASASKQLRDVSNPSWGPNNKKFLCDACFRYKYPETYVGKEREFDDSQLDRKVVGELNAAISSNIDTHGVYRLDDARRILQQIFSIMPRHVVESFNMMSSHSSIDAHVMTPTENGIINGYPILYELFYAVVGSSDRMTNVQFFKLLTQLEERLRRKVPNDFHLSQYTLESVLGMLNAQLRPPTPRRELNLDKYDFYKLFVEIFERPWMEMAPDGGYVPRILIGFDIMSDIIDGTRNSSGAVTVAREDNRDDYDELYSMMLSQGANHEYIVGVIGQPPSASGSHARVPSPPPIVRKDSTNNYDERYAIKLSEGFDHDKIVGEIGPPPSGSRLHSRVPSPPLPFPHMPDVTLTRDSAFKLIKDSNEIPEIDKKKYQEEWVLRKSGRSAKKGGKSRKRSKKTNKRKSNKRK